MRPWARLPLDTGSEEEGDASLVPPPHHRVSCHLSDGDTIPKRPSHSFDDGQILVWTFSRCLRRVRILISDGPEAPISERGLCDHSLQPATRTNMITPSTTDLRIAPTASIAEA